MSFAVKSSAPRITKASTLTRELMDLDPTMRVAPLPTGREDYPQIGIIESAPNQWPLNLDADQLCHFTSGRAVITGQGETLEARPGTVIHLKSGFQGHIEVLDTCRFIYVCVPGSPAQATPVLHDVANVAPNADWGVIPTMIEGESRVSGILLSRDADGRAESGMWMCTPGLWNCHVTHDEFCHFLSGRATYTHESGEVIEIEPDTAAFFPKDWRGTCRVHETVRKVYLIA